MQLVSICIAENNLRVNSLNRGANGNCFV